MSSGSQSATADRPDKRSIVAASMPKGETEAEAMVDARNANDSRREKWYPGEWQSDKRFGAMSKAEWEAQVKFAGLEGQIKDVSGIFTTDLLDEINKFDRAAIEK